MKLPKPLLTPEEIEPIHPYILDALRAARAGDLDALAWLESDCIAWRMLDLVERDLLRRMIANPGGRYRRPRIAQDAPGRTQRRQMGGNPIQTPMRARRVAANVVR